MPTRRAAARPLAACAAVAALLALSGCGLADRAQGSRGADAEPTATASQPPPTSPDARPTAGASPEATTTVTLGGAELHIRAPRAAVVTADGTTAGLHDVALDLAPGEHAELALASGGALDVDNDGSITVLDGNSTPVAALGPPGPPSGTERDAPRIEVGDVDARHARIEVDDRAGSPQRSGEGARDRRVRVAFAAGDQAIESTAWGQNEGGRSLAVDPADWARHAGQAGLDLIRAQLVAAEPEAATATMDDQLVCHAVGAPDKATWNLEPWRPDIGLILTATAHCNPV